ncbi:MAG: nitroreductase family protein [Bacteroidales bacterium]|jgi:nitroreductase|nr:nitroreductase family protein [Bacteroidales bacterium]
MEDILLNRRSIRKYSNKHISQETLDYILQAGVRSSNCGNMQLYSIVVTRDTGKKKELSKFHFNQPMVENCDVVVTVCVDVNRFNHWCRINNADESLNNFLFFNVATIDATICSQAIATAAESKGLGICYLGTVTYMAKDISKFLDLPKGVVPISTITIGYIDENPPLTERLPLSSVVHYEKYNDYSDEDIKKMYKEIEDNPVNKGYVKENHKDNLAQVFTSVRYSKKDNEAFSKTYESFVEENFLNK